MFLVPETKGVTLEEMEDVFGNTGGLATADLKRLEDIHRRLGLIPGSGGPSDAEGGKASGEKNYSDEKSSTEEKA